MDSTLIGIECIDEIAASIGIREQMSQITEATMRGEIDFIQSLQRRVKLLKGISVETLEETYVSKLTLSPGAEQLISFLHEHSIKVAVVSGGFTFFTDRLKLQLGLDFSHANTLEIVDGKLTGELIGDIVGPEEKLNFTKRLIAELGCDLSQVIGIGDGANDLAFLRAVGTSFAYHAKPIVREQTKHAINFSGLDAVCHYCNS